MAPRSISIKTQFLCTIVGSIVVTAVALTTLAAGLFGIEQKLEPPAAVTGDAYQADAPPLPRTLEEATRLLKLSQVARSLLGDVFVDHYVRTREWEVRQYQHAVTDWERERYFEII